MKIAFAFIITALTMTSAGIIPDSAGPSASNDYLSGGKEYRIKRKPLQIR